MAKEKETEHQNISEVEAVQQLIKHRSEILEAFSKAYLAETKLLPSQIELVTQQMPEVDGIIETVYFFRRKDESRG